MEKKFDIFESVTNRITEQLEKGYIPWKRGWKLLGITSQDLRTVAFNRVTKKPYSILNQMLLSKQGEYATYKQWHDIGGFVKKGAKAEMVVFWKWLQVSEKDSETGEETFKKIPILKYYNVFHIDDVEGVEPLTEKDLKTVKDDFNPIEKAENIIATYKERENIGLYFGGDRAYYSPTLDEIHLPLKSQFAENAEYYSTAFHEMTHSTGAKHRLNRLSQNSFFGNETYSKEELVAEIGASGLMSMLGIETENTFTNNAGYIQNWLTVLKNDKKLIVSASSKAEKAINYILNGKTPTEDVVVDE